MNAGRAQEHWSTVYGDGDDRKSWTEDEPRESLRAAGHEQPFTWLVARREPTEQRR
jgi:hypothetical protein